MIWLSSDWHMFHGSRKGGVIALSRRPFPDLASMRRALVDNALKSCRRGDTLVLVGDILVGGSTTQAREALRPLVDAGVTLVAVRGNHDQGPDALLNAGFSLVADRMVLGVRGQRVVVSHYPFRPSLPRRLLLRLRGIRLRYVDRREPDDGRTFLVHGHTHSRRRMEGRAIHVGVDAWGFRPVSMVQVASHVDREATRARSRTWVGRMLVRAGLLLGIVPPGEVSVGKKS